MHESFLLAHAVTAQLESAGVVSVTEGQRFSQSLDAAGNDPFSPLVTFQWMYNGAELNSSQRITLSNYTIDFIDVRRENAGDYQLVVSNSAGSVGGNFTLDVQCKLVCYQIYNFTHAVNKYMYFMPYNHAKCDFPADMLKLELHVCSIKSVPGQDSRGNSKVLTCCP